ncbi:MAG TPA: LysM peptidoglycan-binding domain-containing protein [Mycobacteriales bacterium]
MTVAPELSPVLGTRRLRAAAVDRTPAGVVALVEPARPRRRLVVVPEPGSDAPTEAPAGSPAAEPGTGRVHRPAGPVPLRAAGARVVRPAGGGLRLTRRGQLVAAAAILLIAVLTLVGVASRVGPLTDRSPVPSSAPAQVVVAPGDTLWSIAERVAPQRDPRTVITQLRKLNNLPTTDVHPGQTLLVRTP